MWPRTILTDALALKYPLIQAGMAGGVTTPKLVAAVSNAGGLGTLGAGYLSPEQIRQEIRKIRSLTSRAFAVNLFVPETELMSTGSSGDISAMIDYLQRYKHLLGMGEATLPKTYAESFEDQLAVLIEEAVPAFSFTFGVPTREQITKLKVNGIFVMGTATTVHEAILLESYGVDAIVAQGSEAGGHRGTFLSTPDIAMIGSLALVPQIVDKVRIPVAAAGGIMDGRGVVAGLALGASGVQMGSVFLPCVESGAHASYKEAVVNSEDTSTVVTKAFSGKSARGIRNAFIMELDEYPGAIPPYPMQNALTKEIRKAAARQENPDYMSLWAGQAAGLGSYRNAAQVIEDVVEQVTRVLGRLTNGMSSKEG